MFKLIAIIMVLGMGYTAINSNSEASQLMSGLKSNGIVSEITSKVSGKSGGYYSHSTRDQEPERVAQAMPVSTPVATPYVPTEYKSNTLPPINQMIVTQYKSVKDAYPDFTGFDTDKGVN